MKKLENWLFLWRLSINSSKCQYIIFGRGGNNKKNKINIKLFDQSIPKTNEIKFLGITLDSSVCFKKCIKVIKDKCGLRINILKIIAHKSWKLNTRTLINIYYSLIRSIIDYNAIIYPCLCHTSYKILKSLP
jgi:hypothetical protein